VADDGGVAAAAHRAVCPERQGSVCEAVGKARGPAAVRRQVVDTGLGAAPLDKVVAGTPVH